MLNPQAAERCHVRRSGRTTIASLNNKTFVADGGKSDGDLGDGSTIHRNKGKSRKLAKRASKITLVPYPTSTDEESSNESIEDVHFSQADSNSSTTSSVHSPVAAGDNALGRGLHFGEGDCQDQNGVRKSRNKIQHQSKATRRAQGRRSSRLQGKIKANQSHQKDGKAHLQSPLPAGTPPTRIDTTQGSRLSNQRHLLRFRIKRQTGFGVSGASTSKDSVHRETVTSSERDDISMADNETSEGPSEKRVADLYAIKPATESTSRYTALRHLVELYSVSSQVEDFAKSLRKLCDDEYDVIVAPEKRFEEVKPRVPHQTILLVFVDSTSPKEFEDGIRDVYHGKNYTIVIDDSDEEADEAMRLRPKKGRGGKPRYKRPTD